jgi:type II restriction enzyme
LAEVGKVRTLDSLEPGTFSFRLNVPVSIGLELRKVNIPVDVVIKPKDTSKKPILIEAKSAGDFTNTNKRRKEEAVKYSQIKMTYGEDIPFLLFLCGYFDSGYLGYEAAEGIDWIWEHRMEDLTLLGL